MNKQYEAVKRMKIKYAAKGLCSNGCGGTLKSKTLCGKCLIKKSIRQNPKRKQYRMERIKNGFCYEGCGRKLFSKWLCEECLNAKNEFYRKRYRERIAEHREKSLYRQHKKNFSGLRPAVIDRDKNVCQICFRDGVRVHVHHINEIDKDNRIENLICLCYVCHIVVERINRTKPDLRHLFPWFQ